MLERDYLEIAGFGTRLAADGEAAEAAALSGNFDLILLDLMLPDRSGYDVCRSIRDRVDVPILMVTPPARSRWTRSGGWGWGRTTISPSPSTRRSGWARGKGPPEPVRPAGGRGREPGARAHPGGGADHPAPELEGIQGGAGDQNAPTGNLSF